MSEMITTIFDDGSGRFDKALQGTPPEGGDLTIITKENGTKNGEPIVLLGFTVALGDKKHKVATVTTVRNLIAAVSALVGAYPSQNDRRWPEQPVGNQIEGEHRGMKYRALLMEKFYIVSIPGVKGQISIAGSESDVAPLAIGMIDSWFSTR